MLPTARAHHVGPSLVRCAVAIGGARGGRRMIAYVQRPVVEFFEHLGWAPDGDVFAYCGVDHRQMSIDLRPGAGAMTGRTLPADVSAVNIGLPLFAEALAAQDTPVISVDWRPPAGGDEDAIAALTVLWGQHGARVRDRQRGRRRRDRGLPAADGRRRPRRRRDRRVWTTACCCTRGRRSSGSASATLSAGR